jgi:transcriptional regulator with XRE-family HTH domain
MQATAQAKRPGDRRLDIGKRLRDVRKKNGLSQRELATRAGMTNGAVSLIEMNKTSPSIASLKRLLDAIPMSLSEFFSSVETLHAPKYFYQAAEFTELAPQDLGLTGSKSKLVSLRQLGDAARHTLQILHETYPPNSDTGSELLHHTGEEAGIVIVGQIEITVGDQISLLGPGDGYLFDSTLPHRFRNPGPDECQIVSACTPPTF